tara:strand:+ start:192 stop:464 length:273 start_codon:yes stop_codon:yes gene_type:complete
VLLKKERTSSIIMSFEKRQTLLSHFDDKSLEKNKRGLTTRVIVQSALKKERRSSIIMSFKKKREKKSPVLFRGPFRFYYLGSQNQIFFKP